MKEKRGNDETTNAIRYLKSRKIPFEVHDYVGTGAVSGEEIVAVLGEDPKCVYKTLVTEGKSGAHYVFMIPVGKELDLKKGAAAAGEKNIAMIKSKDLLPLTGYVHGGCSPIGMKKQFPTFIDAHAAEYPKIFFSGGRIGLQIEATLEDLGRVVPVTLCDLTL